MSATTRGQRVVGPSPAVHDKGHHEGGQGDLHSSPTAWVFKRIIRCRRKAEVMVSPA